MASQIDLFEPSSVRFEYYPLLVPSDSTLQNLKNINELLSQQEGIKASQLTKLHHISIDGKITQEDDENIIAAVQKAADTIGTITVNFGEVKFFPGRGLTVYLSITNPEDILTFNQLLMAELGAKTTKLKPHLTLARYAESAHFEKFTNPEIPFPVSSVFDKLVIYKRPYNSKEKYQTIATIRIKDIRKDLPEKN